MTDSFKFRHIVAMVGAILIVSGYMAIMGGISKNLGLAILASAILVFSDCSLLYFVIYRTKWLMRKEQSYLERGEGATVGASVLCLSFLSFAIIIDRTPTSLAASPEAPEGLFVVPMNEFFPLGLEYSIFLYTIIYSIIIVVIGIVVLRLLENPPAVRHIYQTWVPDGWVHVFHKLSILVVVLFLANLLVLVDLGIPGGIEIEGRTPLSIPLTGKLILEIIGVLLVLPVPVYTLPLLPERLRNLNPRRKTDRELLNDYIDANWRRARIITTFALTGAVGIALSFVFSRANPFIMFVVAVVGSITLGPLGVVWFLMRRIREAEKELRPT